MAAALITRFVVIESTPGYLPEDDDPVTFEDITDARVYASDLLSRLLDHIVEGWEDVDETDEEPHAFTVAGSFANTDCFSVFVDDCSRKHGLGRVIEIIETEGGDN
jgi:hypothetical protein